MSIRKQKNQPSPAVLPPALEESPESPELTPDLTHTHAFFFLVYALRMVHLQPPRRPPQPSGRECDVRDLRINPGDNGDLSK
ncbi:hypothetical protein J6590_054394 [Homalodisca vitripennis]|nr:hypothetical protein J6590_054394 [Homalodisca vitripennis]